MIAAQQIFHPITQRVRAFTWPKEISEIGSVDLGELALCQTMNSCSAWLSLTTKINRRVR
jgi:hypothetical protein